METKMFAHIDRPEIANYIRSVGRELAHAVKKSKKANLDNALQGVMYCLNEPVGEKNKSMLDYVPNETVYNHNNDKSRIRSVNNFKNTMEDNKDEIANLFNPFKKGNMNKTFYDRKKEELIRKEKKLEIIKNKKRIEEEKNYKIKPQIAKQSQRIIETKMADKKPIYARANEILNNKNEKLEKLKSMYSELKALEEEESIGSFKPAGTYNEERFVEWRKEREERDRRKNEKINHIKQEIEYLETETMKHLYKPTIDKKSEKIVKSKMSNEELSEPVYDKLYNLHNEKFNKIAQLSMKNMPTFCPSINQKLPNFLQNSISKKTKNSSLSMGNPSILKKLSTYSKHFLNSSVELRSTPLLKGEKISSSEYLVAHHSRNKMNSSMTELYNNPLYVSKYEDDDPEMLSRYRLALQLSSDKVMRLQKKSKFRSNSSFSETSSEYKAQIPWQSSIHYINNKNLTEKDEHPTSLYKINVRNSSAWDKNRENNIYMDQKVSNVLRSVNRVASANK